MLLGDEPLTLTPTNDKRAYRLTGEARLYRFVAGGRFNRDAPIVFRLPLAV